VAGRSGPGENQFYRRTTVHFNTFKRKHISLLLNFKARLLKGLQRKNARGYRQRPEHSRSKSRPIRALCDAPVLRN